MKKLALQKNETTKTDLMILQEEKARIERRCKAKRLPHYKVKESTDLKTSYGYQDTYIYIVISLENSVSGEKKLQGICIRWNL